MLAQQEPQKEEQYPWQFLHHRFHIRWITELTLESIACRGAGWAFKENLPMNCLPTTPGLPEISSTAFNFHAECGRIVVAFPEIDLHSFRCSLAPKRRVVTFGPSQV
jgi:hypothetical protein